MLVPARQLNPRTRLEKEKTEEQKFGGKRKKLGTIHVGRRVATKPPHIFEGDRNLRTKVFLVIVKN